MPSSTIYRLLKDNAGNPTIDILKKLSSFFQITVSQLIGEDPIGCKQIPLVQPSDIYSFIHVPGPINMHFLGIDLASKSLVLAICQRHFLESLLSHARQVLS